ncbi:hypothetical protein [Zhihengliuella halotolerans]|uniref:Uncharacterized protein n=1 Tax=Zhihengliuella halotolerans TaxID=370736 RepID=A0A4Q8AIQ8_9MICC|nr:hypothetical protein [Zhihengliuella halotolerans]RZU63675.1 hypothetical protein EV380_3299 [Zhihengliuella halotolerans]
MRQSLNRAFTTLYAVAMIAFLGLAFILVLAQAAGLVLAQGDWIVGASESLLRPAIIAAVVAGLLGFSVYNVQGRPETEDDKD